MGGTFDSPGYSNLQYLGFLINFLSEIITESNADFGVSRSVSGFPGHDTELANRRK